jgi:hypothetical protein
LVKIDNRTVLDLPCETWGIMGNKIWIHKGVMLEIEGNVMEQSIKERKQR